MDVSATVPEAVFQTEVLLLDGTPLQLPVSTGVPLFVVGPNGSGKSGLMFSLYRKNLASAVRVAAHRQTWMESNSIPFSPKEKLTNESNTRSQDSLPNARWLEWNPSVRSGLIIADLIDADNSLSRKIRSAIRLGNNSEAEKLAKDLPPLETINELLNGSGIPISMTIEPNSTIVASKNGGAPYSIAALSDGERAALLIAGSVLTARTRSLILIDEPERHLHQSIVTPLLLQLFSKRPDCTFVVSTHELGLAVSCPGARTVLVRDSKVVNDDVSAWDLDILEAEVEIDDETKKAIIGSRRKILFIEGTAESLDKPLYEILFPRVSIFPRSTCSDVEHAVTSVGDSAPLVWVQAFGIVDQDQLPLERKQALEAKSVFPLAVYSVEGLYYNPTIVEAVARRQCTILGGASDQMIIKAWKDLLSAIVANLDRLAARMTEQVVKDQIGLRMPNWKKIQAGENVDIAVDAQAHYQNERELLREWISVEDVGKIISRYPIRETQALAVIASALQFKSRTHYEAAVRKLITDDAAIKDHLLGYFGKLSAAMA